jgi:hypothetical protein
MWWRYLSNPLQKPLTPQDPLNFAFQQVLLAVIFFVDSAMDLLNEHQNGVFIKIIVTNIFEVKGYFIIPGIA